MNTTHPQCKWQDMQMILVSCRGHRYNEAPVNDISMTIMVKMSHLTTSKFKSATKWYVFSPPTLIVFPSNANIQNRNTKVQRKLKYYKENKRESKIII